MIFIHKYLLAIIFVTSGVVACYSQNCASSIPIIPGLEERCRIVGKARVQDLGEKEGKSVSIRQYILGKADNIDRNGSYGRINVINDVLIMVIAYRALQNTVPQFIYFELMSYSNEPSKYENDNNLTIYIDNEPLLSKNLKLRSSITVAEKFSLEMDFFYLHKIAEAKKVVVQIGETKIELSPEVLDAIKDLNRTTKNLKSAHTPNCLGLPEIK